MSFKKRILGNGVASLLSKIVKILEQLLLVPFFIKYWGTEYYGDWLTLTIVPAFLGMSDLGFGTATANSFLLRYASGDKKDAADIAKTGLICLTYLVCIVFFISCIILFLLKDTSLLIDLTISNLDAVYVLLILLFGRFIFFYTSVFEGFFRAARKAHLSIILHTIYSLLVIIVGFLVLTFGGKAIFYSISITIIGILFVPIYGFISLKILKYKELENAKFVQKKAKYLINNGVGYFLSPIWQAIYYQGTTFVIRIVLGATAVTIFNTIRTLIRSSSQAFAMVVTSIYPEFQFEIGSGSKLKAKKLFMSMLISNIFIAFVFVVFLSLFGRQFYEWWINNEFLVSNSLWIVFVSSIFFYSIWFSYSFIFEASNMPYNVTIPGLIFSLISIGFCWLLSSKFGLIGGAISMLIFDVFMLIYMIFKTKIVLKITLEELKIFILNLFSIKIRL